MPAVGEPPGVASAGEHDRQHAVLQLLDARGIQEHPGHLALAPHHVQDLLPALAQHVRVHRARVAARIRPRGCTTGRPALAGAASHAPGPPLPAFRSPAFHGAAFHRPVFRHAVFRRAVFLGPARRRSAFRRSAFRYLPFRRLVCSCRVCRGPACRFLPFPRPVCPGRTGRCPAFLFCPLPRFLLYRRPAGTRGRTRARRVLT